MKKSNKKGFTLAELLVVVAIIAVLVAISVPIFTGQLKKAQKATNQANLRAAKAAAVAEYLTDDSTGTVTYNYDINAGTITAGTADTTSIKTIADETGDKAYTEISVSITGTEVTLYAE